MVTDGTFIVVWDTFNDGSCLRSAHIALADTHLERVHISPSGHMFKLE